MQFKNTLYFFYFKFKMFKAIVVIWFIITVYIILTLQNNYYYVVVPDNAFLNMQPEEFRRLTDAHNTHDSLVRQALWQKFSILYKKNVPAEVIKNSVNHAEYYITKTGDSNLVNLINVIKKKHTVTTCKDLGLPEEISEYDVFGIVWNEFITQNLSLDILVQQMRDCYENNELVCIVGRVSRYISAFEGIVDSELGKSEVTENIIFQQALNESQKLYTESKKNISDIIVKKYPQVDHRIEEIMQAF